MLRLASSVRLARRAFSTDVAPKIDWSELTAFVHSDEAKREISMLKKSLEDMKEQLAAEATARRPAARASRANARGVPTGPCSASLACCGAAAASGARSTRPAAAA